ncbi:MAG: hypothetical protein BroJett020_18980 [Bacteroidota bacterium]|nr:MAG: hypothetical protein BroJett020_18980 [Bacteroidota bacterium]
MWPINQYIILRRRLWRYEKMILQILYKSDRLKIHNEQRKIQQAKTNTDIQDLERGLLHVYFSFYKRGG